MAATPQRWQFQEDTLENGLRVITMEDHRTPLVNLQVWYHVGSKDENPERQGFAHMFEHMMFRGTDRIGPQDHFKHLQRYGARVNGYTSFDMTVYWETLPASQLDRAMWLEAERLANLKINEDYFAAEREVVKEERRMRYLNKPYGRLYETLFRSAFREHPYRWTPIGNMPHLDAATVDELREFFNTYYVPNNATLVVVGDVTHAQVLARAREYFGPIPRKPDPPRVTKKEPPLNGPHRVEITDIAPSPMIVHAYHAPSAKDREDLALDVLRRIVSSGQSSRLYRHLVQGKEIAVSVSSNNSSFEDHGLYYFQVTLKPGVSIEEGEKALVAEVDDLLANGFDAKELEKARNQAVAEIVRTGETVQGRADQLGYAAVILGDPDRVNTDLEYKRMVSADEIMRVAREVFRPENRVELIIRPGEKPVAEQTEDKARKAEKIESLEAPAEMPAGKPPQPIELPQPIERRLANGMRVLVFPDTSTKAVTVTWNTLVGAKDDPAEQAGLASVVAGTMRRGTKRHSGDELAEIIDFHAMSLTEQVDHDDSNFRMWSLSDYTELAVETLAEVVREPTFPENEVSNYVTRAAAREAIKEKDPSTIATRTFARVLYRDHYLSQATTGTSKTLKGITREAVAEFHQRYFGPRQSVLTFAGDITPSQAFELAERFFGDWENTTEPGIHRPAPVSTPPQVVIVDQPGAVQSEIRIGQIAPVSRRDPDYPAVRLLSQIFGESFSGRLNRALRIERGLTYGASGYFEVEREAAAFKIGTFTRTEKTAEAVTAALDEVRRLQTEPVTQEELDDARDTILGGFQMALETPAQIAARHWDLIVWDLPPNWYSLYLQGIAATRDPGVLEALAQKKLRPDSMAVLVVGDAEKVRPALAPLGPVTSMPAE